MHANTFAKVSLWLSNTGFYGKLKWLTRIIEDKRPARLETNIVVIGLWIIAQFRTGVQFKV